MEIVKKKVSISIWQKISYVTSNLGTAFSWGYITSYFMMFCTDAVGISAYVFSALLLCSRIFDGFTDFICGHIMDKTITKWGRYRPWIFLFSIPVAVCTVLLFHVSAENTPMMKVLKIAIIYMIYLMIFTIFRTPLDAMSSVMSADAKERASIISMKSSAGLVGVMIMIQIAANYFDANGTDTVEPYFNLAIIFGIISVPMYLLTPLFCKEKIIPKKQEKKKQNLWEAAKQNLKNKAFRIAFTGHFLNGLILYGRVSIFVYYFKYVVNDMALYATFILLVRLSQIAGTYAAQYVLRWLKKPGVSLCIIYTLYGISLTANFFVIPQGKGLILFWILTSVSSFLFGISYSLIYMIIPDLIDYSEEQTGNRNDGGISAMLGFGNKVGMALGTSGMGVVLGLLGFHANMAQTAEVVTGINALMYVLPGILSILIGILFSQYKLKEGCKQKKEEKL